MATADYKLPDAARGGDLTRVLGLDTPRRVLRFASLARALLATALLLAASAYREPPLLGETWPVLFFAAALGWTLFGWAAWAWQRRRAVLLPRQVLLQLAIDIAAVTTLMYASGGIRSGLGALLVVFVGAASLTLNGRESLFAAAVAALAVLGQQLAGYSAGSGAVEDFVPAGVLGGIIFAVAAAAWPLARRLEESEALARQRGIDLANLAQLNDYIIQNLRESIVVVDEEARIRLVNPSAAQHLGLRSRAPGQPLAGVSPALHRLLAEWRQDPHRLRQLPSFLAADGSTQVNTYIAPLGAGDDGPALIFLEDAALLAEKVQQSKLAALGRLSASIAHEIRNPVGALSHAAQLLAESPAIGDEDRRLLEMIRNHSRRVSGIVDSVLQLSRREPSRPELISLDEFLAGFAAEFRETLQLQAGELAVDSAAGTPVQVRMDPGHLRQLLWNLCENAVRYGRDGAGQLRLELRCGRLAANDRPFLEVADRGPGVAAELRERIFEPFATGRAGGTGLGLFISRELCEFNRAALLHEPRAGGGSLFRVVFADPIRWAA